MANRRTLLIPIMFLVLMIGACMGCDEDKFLSNGVATLKSAREVYVAAAKASAKLAEDGVITEAQYEEIARAADKYKAVYQATATALYEYSQLVDEGTETEAVVRQARIRLLGQFADLQISIMDLAEVLEEFGVDIPQFNNLIQGEE